jgi:hypothetical protein
MGGCKIGSRKGQRQASLLDSVVVTHDTSAQYLNSPICDGG